MSKQRVQRFNQFSSRQKEQLLKKAWGKVKKSPRKTGLDSNSLHKISPPCSVFLGAEIWMKGKENEQEQQRQEEKEKTKKRKRFEGNNRKVKRTIRKKTTDGNRILGLILCSQEPTISQKKIQSATSIKSIAMTDVLLLIKDVLTPIILNHQSTTISRMLCYSPKTNPKPKEVDVESGQSTDLLLLH